jgi:serine/threonine protein kinase
VAIKIYRPKNALDIEGEQRFRDEFKIVYECRHANVLQPTSFSIYNDLPYLVLPYCKFGSSEQLSGKKQKAAEIWKFILDVASGL